MKKKTAIVIGLGLNGSCAINELIKKKFNVIAIDANDFALFQKKNLPFFILNKIANKLKYLVKFFYKKTFLEYKFSEIGGRGNFWGRVSPRFSENCISKKNKWPIKYKNLKKYFNEIEKKFILRGSKKKISFFNSNVIKFKSYNKIEKKLIKILKKNNLNFTENSLPVLDYSTKKVNPMLDEVLNNKNLKIIANEKVIRIFTSEKGLIEKIETVNKRNKIKKYYYADFFILCCSPIENIKLLLNSRNKIFPNGLGNNNGIIGKNFLDHICIAYNAKIKNNLKKKIDIDPNHPNKYTNGFFLIFNKKLKKFKKKLRFSIHGTICNKTNLISIYSFCDSFLNIKNKIYFNNKENKLNINFKWSKIEIEYWKKQKSIINKIIKILREDLKLNLEETDANRQSYLKIPSPGFSNHESGGLIMGSNKKNSFTDEFGKAWCFKNLIICDQSIFPYLSFANPTLTSMAITLRSIRNL